VHTLTKLAAQAALTVESHPPGKLREKEKPAERQDFGGLKVQLEDGCSTQPATS
jgi:hypothetical protein